LLCPKCETTLFSNSNYCPNCQENVDVTDKSEAPDNSETFLTNETRHRKAEREKTCQSSDPSLIKMDIILLIFLTIITFGLFVEIWFLIQRPKLNRLKSSKKLGISILIICLLLYLSALILAVFSVIVPGFLLSEDLDLLSDLLILTASVLLILQRFKVRHILYNHCNNYLQQNLYMPGLLVLFFDIFYLQYKINRLDFCKENEG